MSKRVITVKAKAIIHTVREYKKWASNIEEARELVQKEPNSFLSEEKISSKLNDDFLPCWILEEDQILCEQKEAERG